MFDQLDDYLLEREEGGEAVTDEEIITDALEKFPDCKYGIVVNGMNCFFQVTRVVNLWRNEECYLADDKPRHVVEGYPGYGHIPR